MSTPTEPTVVTTERPVSQHGEIVGGEGAVEDLITPEEVANAWPWKPTKGVRYVEEARQAIRNDPMPAIPLDPDRLPLLERVKAAVAAGETPDPEDTRQVGLLPDRELITVKVKRRETDEERTTREGAASAPAPAAKTTTTSKTSTTSTPAP